MTTIMKNLGLDRYEWNARLRPAFVVLLPAWLVIAIWAPQIWTRLLGFSSMLVTCGLTYLLAQVARSRGRALEKKFIKEIGREHTARLLSRTDRNLSDSEKERYRTAIASCGIALPSASDEVASPERSHELYRGAVAWLLEKTRSNADKTMLLDENISYGFRRNLLGLKPIGLTVTGAALSADVLLTWRASWGGQESITGIIIGFGLISMLLAWLFLVTKKFVIDASQAYAVRLLAQCEHLSPPAPKTLRARKTDTPRTA